MKTLEERFWEKVDKNGPAPPHVPELGPCWVWTAGVNSSGYAWMWLDGRPRLGSRIVWRIVSGEDPTQDVLHRCDNPRCVRPEHLFLGSDKDNARDKIRKGRAGRVLRGAEHPRARTTAEDVIDMRVLRAFGATYNALASAYGLSKRRVRDICLGRCWAHVREGLLA